MNVNGKHNCQVLCKHVDFLAKMRNSYRMFYNVTYIPDKKIAFISDNEDVGIINLCTHTEGNKNRNNLSLFT